jgi:hypothetical protein
MSSRPSIENDRRNDPMSVFPFAPNMSIDAIQPMVANMAQFSGKGFTSLMEGSSGVDGFPGRSAPARRRLGP